MAERDDLYSRPLGDVSDFVFDDNVARVFPDMIRRSVPGYETIVAMTGTLADRYLTPGSRCYDLGCSLGASTLAVARNTRNRPSTLVAVDNSPAMIERCREMLARLEPAADIDLLCDDIRNVTITDASMVVLNFTLQFLPVAEREILLETIFSGLNPGGILVLSEKVRFEDPHLDELMIELHHNFKRANGYSDLEVSQKRTALENVLVRESLREHRERLNRAGFRSADVWFQCFNFASLLAIKPGP